MKKQIKNSKQKKIYKSKKVKALIYKGYRKKCQNFKIGKTEV